MLPDEYAKALERLGFSNRGFCIWIGVTERAGRLWKSGDAPVPATLAAFLRLALRLKLSAARLREILERA
jgi:hypothetical protein